MKKLIIIFPLFLILLAALSYASESQEPEEIEAASGEPWQITGDWFLYGSLVWFIGWLEWDYGPYIYISERYGEIELNHPPAGRPGS